MMIVDIDIPNLSSQGIQFRINTFYTGPVKATSGHFLAFLWLDAAALESYFTTAHSDNGSLIYCISLLCFILLPNKHLSNNDPPRTTPHKRYDYLFASVLAAAAVTPSADTTSVAISCDGISTLSSCGFSTLSFTDTFSRLLRLPQSPQEE